MTVHEIVATRLIPQCEQICGNVIDRVTYDVLRGEATVDDIDDSDFYLGGDVVLSFRKADPLFVSWDRITRRHDDTICTLTLGPKSLFIPGGLQSSCANETKLWSSHIAQTVDTVALYGDDGVPFVLSIQTKSGTILIGTSYQTSFGDGDDVFIATGTKAIKSMSQSGNPNTRGNNTVQRICDWKLHSSIR